MKHITLLISTFLLSNLLLRAQIDSFKCATTHLDYIDNLMENENTELWAGNCKSQNGYHHTPRGNLRVLVVYVVYNDAQPDDNSSWWPENGIPNFAALNGAANDVIDSDPNNPTNRHNLTTWYRTMSNGEFTMTVMLS